MVAAALACRAERLRRSSVLATTGVGRAGSVVDRVAGGGLASGWVSLLRDWDRTLRASNYPETTRYNYVLAAAQLA
jgi:hypothetical protein